VSQFENFGIRVAEGGTRSPDLCIRVYVSYQPEWGLLVHRSVAIGVRVLDTNGTPLLRELATRTMSSGLIGEMFISRDEFLTSAARKAVTSTMQELERGTKRAVGMRASPATATQPSAGPLPGPAGDRPGGVAF
jgi:hypothetical protein